MRAITTLFKLPPSIIGTNFNDELNKLEEYLSVKETYIRQLREGSKKFPRTYKNLKSEIYQKIKTVRDLINTFPVSDRERIRKYFIHVITKYSNIYHLIYEHPPREYEEPAPILLRPEMPVEEPKYEIMRDIHKQAAEEEEEEEKREEPEEQAEQAQPVEPPPPPQEEKQQIMKEIIKEKAEEEEEPKPEKKKRGRPRKSKKGKGSGIFKNVIDYVRYGERRQLPPHIRKFMKEHGHKQITYMKVCRTPIMSFFDLFLNAATFGKWSKTKLERNYDNFYHTFIVFSLGDTQLYKIEKNHAIELTNYAPSKYELCINVNTNNVTFNDMINNAYNKHGLKYILYNPINANCQRFVIWNLEESNILTDDVRKFILQDVTEVIDNLSTYIITPSARLAHKLDTAVFGQGILKVFPEF